MASADRQHHVLLVDDEPQILEALTDLLEDLFAVHTAGSAAEAMQALRRHPVAVLVADQRMPGMTGDAVLAEAAELSLATRVLLTGYSDLEAVVRAVNRGHIYAYVAKPWDPMELRLTLSRAAEHYELVRRLNHEQRLLHELMENVPDAIFYKDGEQRFTRVNRAKAALVGVSDPRELLGRGDWDFVPPAEAARIAREDEQVLRQGRAVIDRVEPYTPPDGNVRWLSTTKVPLELEAGRGLVGISRDITERKEAQEKLESVRMETESEKKTFYREVVRAVTGGGLNLVDPEELPELPRVDLDLGLEDPENYRRLRDRLAALCSEAGLAEEQCHDLVLATGEAATNAIKHARGGRCLAAVTEEGIVVRISDGGSGIHPRQLPASLFRAGYSTKVSLGLGYTLILRLVDSVWLATGPGGTTVQLLKQTEPIDQDEAELLALLDRY